MALIVVLLNLILRLTLFFPSVMLMTFVHKLFGNELLNTIFRPKQSNPREGGTDWRGWVGGREGHRGRQPERIRVTS